RGHGVFRVVLRVAAPAALHVLDEVAPALKPPRRRLETARAQGPRPRPDEGPPPDGHGDADEENYQQHREAVPRRLQQTPRHFPAIPSTSGGQLPSNLLRP